MNFVSRSGSRVVIRQVPLILSCVAAGLSLPFLGFALFHILRGTEAEGKLFCLVFGLLLLWVCLEFVATRARIEVDQAKRVLTSRVSGVFRHKQQVINLRDIKGIGLEVKVDQKGIRRLPRQYLYLYGRQAKFLLNSPAQVSVNQARLGRILSDVTRLPYQEQTDNP